MVIRDPLNHPSVRSPLNERWRPCLVRPRKVCLFHLFLNIREAWLGEATSRAQSQPACNKPFWALNLSPPCTVHSVWPLNVLEFCRNNQEKILAALIFQEKISGPEKPDEWPKVTQQVVEKDGVSSWWPFQSATLRGAYKLVKTQSTPATDRPWVTLQVSAPGLHRWPAGTES